MEKKKRLHVLNRPIRLLMCLPIVAACTPETGQISKDVAKGQQLYTENCAICHGADARGGGAASLGLGEAPPSLVSLSRQNRGLFPRAYVIEIVQGKVGPDHPTAAMPEFGSSELGRPVRVESDGKEIVVPLGLLALANYLESIQE